MKMEKYSTLKTHISKEIEVNIQSRYSFRGKINFTLYISPFILLGTYFYTLKDHSSGFKISFDKDLYYIIFCALIYLFIGFIASKVEDSMMERNDTLRELLFDLENGGNEFNLLKFKSRPNLWGPYLLIYSLLLLEFTLILIMIYN